MTKPNRLNSLAFGCKWRLDLFPGGSERAAPGMVFIYICSRSIPNEHIDIDFFFSVRGPSGKEVAYCETERFTFAAPTNINSGHWDWGEPNFEHNYNILEKALVEGALTIEVRMRLHEPNVPPSQFIPENPLCNNILKMFMDEESADVIFEVGCDSQQGGNVRKRAKTSTFTTVHAHRFILQDVSSTMAELCKSDGGEVTTVRIDDVNPDIFRHLLYYYIYGGKVSDDDLKPNAKEIIDASDKYGIVHLKLEAEACYVESTIISIENAIDDLLYADAKNCALLKEVVMDFLVDHKDDVIGKVSFDNVPGSMMTDLLTAMARG